MRKLLTAIVAALTLLAVPALAQTDADTDARIDSVLGDHAAYRAAFGRRLTVDGYATVDLRAGVNFDRFSISAYVRNLTNTRGLVSAGGFPYTIPPVVGGNSTQFVNVSSIRPRTIGLTLGFEY